MKGSDFYVSLSKGNLSLYHTDGRYFLDCRMRRQLSIGFWCNAKDFATLFRQYYGQDVGAEFEELLTAHFTIAAELVKAVKAGETATATNADKRWYENANQIADFLSGINPYWSAQEWKNMLYDHLALTKKETESILKGNYEESINVFDEIERQALMMADTMMQGMRKQFSQYL